MPKVTQLFLGQSDAFYLLPLALLREIHGLHCGYQAADLPGVKYARMPTQRGEEEAKGGPYIPSDMGAFAEVMQGGETLPFHNTL